MPARIYNPAQSQLRESDGGLIIGLVNNMPDAAIRSTERQFLALLNAAASDLDVTVRLFMLPQMPRSVGASDVFLGNYASTERLGDITIDALIVTGAEPKMPELTQEPYWPAFAELVDWAEDHTISTIWSCLAAHAAVLHLDGINRKRLDGKLSGVFECAKTSDHALVAGAPSHWPVPHSRFNDLAAADLESRGYRPLARSPVAGIDMFIKQRNSLFLFFQGHLEYESRSLLREYLRDITRFVDGERDAYPQMPLGYLDAEATLAFEAVREAAMAKRNAKPMAAKAASFAEQRLANVWKSQAAGIYGNWLHYIWQQKSLRQSAIQPVAA